MPSEFKVIVRNGKRLQVHRLDNGAEGHRHGQGERQHFSAHDAKGQHLGDSKNKEEAVFMAENGYTNELANMGIAELPERTLSSLWNAAIEAGAWGDALALPFG